MVVTEKQAHSHGCEIAGCPVLASGLDVTIPDHGVAMMTQG